MDCRRSFVWSVEKERRGDPTGSVDDAPRFAARCRSMAVVIVDKESYSQHFNSTFSLEYRISRLESLSATQRTLQILDGRRNARSLNLAQLEIARRRHDKSFASSIAVDSSLERSRTR